MTAVVPGHCINPSGHAGLPLSGLHNPAHAVGADPGPTHRRRGTLVKPGAIATTGLSVQIDRRAGKTPPIDSRSLAEREALLTAGPEERVLVVPGADCLHSPKHLCGSKTAGQSDRRVGRPSAARNWRRLETLRDPERGLVR